MLGGYSLGSVGATPRDVAERWSVRPPPTDGGPEEYSLSPAMPSPVLPEREETVPLPPTRSGLFGGGGGKATVGQRPARAAREPRFAEASEARPSWPAAVADEAWSGHDGDRRSASLAFAGRAGFAGAGTVARRVDEERSPHASPPPRQPTRQWNPLDDIVHATPVFRRFDATADGFAADAARYSPAGLRQPLGRGVPQEDDTHSRFRPSFEPVDSYRPAGGAAAAPNNDANTVARRGRSAPFSQGLGDTFYVPTGVVEARQRAVNVGNGGGSRASLSNERAVLREEKQLGAWVDDAARRVAAAASVGASKLIPGLDSPRDGSLVGGGGGAERHRSQARMPQASWVIPAGDFDEDDAARAAAEAAADSLADDWDALERLAIASDAPGTAKMPTATLTSPTVTASVPVDMLPAERPPAGTTAAPVHHFAVPNGRRTVSGRRGDDGGAGSGGDDISAGGKVRRRLAGYTYTRRRRHVDGGDASEALTRRLCRPLSRTIADTAAEALHKSRNGQPLPPNEGLVGVAFPTIDGELNGRSASPDAKRPLTSKRQVARSSYDPATVAGGGDERLPPRLMDLFGNPHTAGGKSTRVLSGDDGRGGTPRDLHDDGNADGAMAFHSFFASPSRPERSRMDPLANARFASM